MNRQRVLLGLVVLSAIITTFALSTSNKNNKYDYEFNVRNVLPIAGNGLSSLLIANHIEVIKQVEEETNSSEDMDSDLTQEEIKTEEENKTTEGQIIKEDENKYNEETETVVDNKTVSPDKGNLAKQVTQTNDNRTVPSSLSQHLNNYVLDVIRTYNYQGGDYPYLLNNDYENYNGVTEDIYYKGEVLLKGHSSGIKYSHCTGISFEVFFKAMQNRNRAHGIDINDFNGMTKEEMHDFMLTWYVAKGAKSQSNLAVAIEKYGLGNRITNLEEAAPGDFIDLSRENNTGHAIIFLDWIRQGDRIIGLKFWSSQQSTSGISHKEEYFNIKDSNGKKYGNVILDSLYIARVNPISEYK